MSGILGALSSQRIHYGTLTAGNQAITPTFQQRGLNLSVGSFTPAAITTALSVLELYDQYNPAPTYAETILTVSGFTADPGRTWLSFVIANGVKQDQSAAAYIYSGGSGRATWDWTTPFNFVTLSVYSVTLAWRG
jgi:hypothetical protein